MNEIYCSLEDVLGVGVASQDKPADDTDAVIVELLDRVLVVLDNGPQVYILVHCLERLGLD